MADEKTVTVYDKKAEYKSTIAPILKQLIKECTKNKIPMFVSFAPANDEEETTYVNDGVLTGSMNITLKDDLFEKYLGVLHGGRVVFSGGDPELSEGKMFDYIAENIEKENQPVDDEPEDMTDYEAVMKNKIE